jgi:hypothetical protein
MQKALEFDQAAVRETPEGLKPEYIEAAEIVPGDMPGDAQEPVDVPTEKKLEPAKSSQPEKPHDGNLPGLIGK